jgi:hypothetical protein
MDILRRNERQRRAHASYIKSVRVMGLLVLFLSFLNAPLCAGENPVPAVKPDIQSTILASLRSGQIADAQNAVVDPTFVLSLVTRPTTELPNGVRLANAHFTSVLDLSDSQIPSSLRLTFCTFDNGIDFTGMHVAGDLSLEHSTFLYPPGWKDFSNSFINLRVFGDTSLNSAVFSGPVDFTNAQFLGEFTADSTSFLAPYTSADFQYAQFRSAAFFRRAVITGTLTMWFAEMQDFTLTFDSKSTIRRIEMPQAIVQRSLAIQGGTLHSLGLGAVRVLGTASLGPVCVTQQVDLHTASFDTLSFNITPCPGPNDKYLVYVSGLRYVYITSDNGGPPTDSVLTLLASSNLKGIPNDPSNPPDLGLFAQYPQFEAFLRAHSYPGDADTVLVTGKRRERAVSLQPWLSAGWWQSVFLDKLNGYGTEPLRPMVFCIIVVIIATVILGRPDLMNPTDDKHPTQKYSAFWYSLDKFAPVIDLKVADAWEPKTPGLQRFTIGLRILGFILVPLAFASFSGLFK